MRGTLEEAQLWARIEGPNRLSRNQRRKITNLVYRVVALEFPDAEIERDRLHRRYPDTNYGVSILLKSKEEAERVLLTLSKAFEQRSLTLHGSKIWLNSHREWVLDVGHYYRA